MKADHSSLRQYDLKSSKNVGLRCAAGRCDRYLSISNMACVLSMRAFMTGMRKLYESGVETEGFAEKQELPVIIEV